ncbi:MAG TPA: hypothetical protein PLN69_11320 [bacterium]|nr:hypothetical protein [bacterium]
MSKWRRIRRNGLRLLVALTAINFFVLFVIAPRSEISLDSFFIVTGMISFVLLILTIDIGGKYVLYTYLFLLSFVINGTIGARAGMIGETKCGVLIADDQRRIIVSVAFVHSYSVDKESKTEIP